ncbi:MAG TPA: type II toxin-antitoxin system RelE/ParE family toxin [Phycisphaerae bacterium]|nr:type II toxin-antitoxin system RelE/ParE family toxin [Phycisphaerae bacterium]
MKPVRFLTPASEEMVAAAVWYDQQVPGLGGAFLDRVEAAVAFLGQYPEAGQELKDGFRRRLLRQFPFALLYSVEPDEIIVHAVMHLRRRPGYWRDRRS